MFGVVEAGPVESLGDQAGQGSEDRPFFRGEAAGPVVGEQQRTDGPAGGDQGEEGPCGLAVLENRIRVLASEVRKAGEELRNPVGQHMYRGRAGGGSQGQAVEAVDELGAATAVSDDPQPPFLHRHQRAGLGPEGGHDLIGHLLDHIPHLDRLGERGGEVHQVVQVGRPPRRGGRGRGRRAGRVLLGGRGGRGDPDAEAGRRRIEPEGEPPVRRAGGVERRRPGTDQRLPVALLDGRGVQPRQNLPRHGAHQLVGVASEQFGGRGRGEGHPAFQVQRAAAARQAVDELHRGRRLGGVRLGGGARDQDARLRLGAYRDTVVRGLLEEQAEAITARVHRLPLVRCELRPVQAGPQQDKPAPHHGVGDEGSGGQRKIVRQNERGPGVPLSHLLPAAQPYEAAGTHGVRHGDRRGQRYPHPRGGDVAGHSGEHDQAQQPLARREQVEQAHRGARIPHALRHDGLQHLPTGPRIISAFLHAHHSHQSLCGMGCPVSP